MDLLQDNSIRVVSIDPGSALVGITLWRYSPKTNKLEIVDCWTVRLARYEKSEVRDLEKIEKRLLGLRSELKHIFKRFKPLGVVTESNFLMKKKVSGFKALLLTQCAIREAISETLPSVELDIMHVIAAKKFMDAKSNAKEDVHEKVVDIHDVIYPDDFDGNSVGPDALDSIAIGYCFIKQHWGQLETIHNLYK